MAKRITVVITQSAQRDAAVVDLEETLVAELMMTSGLDATLVGPLESIEEGSTDYLCLSSLPRSFAVVSWLGYSDVVQHWQRLKMRSVIQQLNAANQPTPSGVATGIYLELGGQDTIPDIVAALQKVQQTPDVQTFGIALPLAGKPAAPVTPDDAAKPGDAFKPDAPTSRQQLPVVADSPPVGRPVINQQEVVDDDEEFSQLDQLIDDLDNFE